jgi:AcrR family transcriptional regulator
MARTKTIEDRDILDIARKVFLSDGFGASTAVIAKKAGISEALLFKRFNTKDELFAATMGFGEMSSWAHEAETLIGKSDVRNNIKHISLQIVEMLRTIIPRHMMVWSARIKPSSRREMRNPIIQRHVKALTEYFGGEMKLCRIRRCDPQVCARTLLGALHNYVFFELMDIHLDASMDETLYIKNLTDLFWSGLSPDSFSKKSGAKKCDE